MYLLEKSDCCLQKLGYKNVENLSFSKIKRKYTHSYEILRQYDHDVHIDERFALIFSKDRVSKAYSWIKRTARESAKKEAANWDVYSPESFCNYINYGREIPLSPTEETKEKVCRWCSNYNIGFDELVIICEEISNYWWKIKGNRLIVDQEYVVKNIKPFLSALIPPEGEDIEMYDFAKTELLSILES
ncbi:MAG: hypothetical protein K2H60_04895 [Muribaculaceae bacterium]|nr:hypothetical protein [Muribaculaceae bacterium]